MPSSGSAQRPASIPTHVNPSEFLPLIHWEFLELKQFISGH